MVLQKVSDLVVPTWFISNFEGLISGNGVTCFNSCWSFCTPALMSGSVQMIRFHCELFLFLKNYSKHETAKIKRYQCPLFVFGSHHREHNINPNSWNIRNYTLVPPGIYISSSHHKLVNNEKFSGNLKCCLARSTFALLRACLNFKGYRAFVHKPLL